jgi:hypothetical protein
MSSTPGTKQKSAKQTQKNSAKRIEKSTHRRSNEGSAMFRHPSWGEKHTTSGSSAAGAPEVLATSQTSAGTSHTADQRCADQKTSGGEYFNLDFLRC